jgi:flagellar basal-body rod protein FlgG
MNYGLYLGAAGVLTNMHRQDVLTNNLANTETVGFKPDQVYTRQRLPERLESGAMIDPQGMLERLGGGPALVPTRLDLTQGGLTVTNNDLDVAVEGEGFLVVSGGSGGGPESVRLTRDGRLSLTADGRLVAASSGMPVLNTNNQSILLDRSTQVEIRPNGDVVQNGVIQATIQLATPRDPADLEKAGQNVLRSRSGGPIARHPAGGRIRQGHLEESGARPTSKSCNTTTASWSRRSTRWAGWRKPPVPGRPTDGHPRP